MRESGVSSDLGQPSASWLRAYARDHACQVAHEEGATRARLISVAGCDARIQLEGGARPLRLGQAVCLRPNLGPAGEMECVVSWVSGQEAGLDFRTRPSLGLSELQALLS